MYLLCLIHLPVYVLVVNRLISDNISVRPHNLTDRSDCRLQCEVNVTRGPGRVLSILHNGRRLPTAAGGGGAGSAHVVLSGNVSLTEAGEYECQLHVNDELVTRSVFHHRPLMTRCRGKQLESNNCIGARRSRGKRDDLVSVRPLR